MVTKQVFEHEFLQDLFNLFFVDADKITDRKTSRKIFLMFTIGGIGVFVLCLMSLIAWFRHEYLLAALDCSVALVLIALICYLRRSCNHVFCCYASVVLMSLLFLYFFMSGAGAGNTLLWLYTYPLFVLFLLGSRHGARAILLFSVSCFGFLCINLFFSDSPRYQPDFAVRFVPSFLTVSLLAFMFEKSGEQARKFLMDAQAVLEEKVAERTGELQREINDRKAKEERLAISEQRYRTLFDSNGDAVSIVGVDWRFLEVNHEFCSRLGWSHAELMQMTAVDVCNPSSRESVAGYLADLFEKRKESVVLEAEYLSRTGESLPVELRAKVILFDNKNAVLTIGRDIRDRKQMEEAKKKLEEQLHRSQKMEAIGLMAGGVAHDLNNILSGVIAYPDILLHQLPQNHPMNKSLTIIKESGTRAAAVVADLLTVARGVAHQRETANLNVLIDEYLSSPEQQMLALKYPQIQCVTGLTPDLQYIECSVIHIKKSLMNLVINAIEAIQGVGVVTVSTWNKDVDVELARTLHLVPGQFVVMAVRDTGTGINEIDRQQIFEPFYTKKKMGRSGTGLGLTVVWNTMQDHKGTVTIESDGNGSVFTLYFPVSGEQPVGVTKNLAMEPPRGRGESLLVVDDDALQRDIAVKMLTMLGYSPKAVASGEEAVMYMQDGVADLLLLDMLMEPGMNGYQTYAEIIKVHPGQKAVIVSGFSENEEVVKAHQLGTGGFIKKPYTIQQLGHVVQKVLSG